MPLDRHALGMVKMEARALIAHLDFIKPLSMQMPMVPAGSLSQDAMWAIERHMGEAVERLKQRLMEFIASLRKAGRGASPAMAQRTLAVLKLNANDLMSQYDIFADVYTQRGEHDNGVLLSGLDVLARETLSLPGVTFGKPPIVTYFYKGLGGAIRRVQTRLPGGDQNPVAVIRIPRGRLMGTGLSSSMVHEVGHQGAVLLGLIEPLRAELESVHRRGGSAAEPWRYFGSWTSEMLADLWAISKVGVASTLGLMSLTTLPRAFVFRYPRNDPHPFPWIRVWISCALGNALYPDPQWERLVGIWSRCYPKDGLGKEMSSLAARLEARVPDFARRVLGHKPEAFKGKSLGEVFHHADRTPGRLRRIYARWEEESLVRTPVLSPSMTFAVLGQAKADGKLTPEVESKLLNRMLKQWALCDKMAVPGRCPAGAAARAA